MLNECTSFHFFFTNVFQKLLTEYETYGNNPFNPTPQLQVALASIITSLVNTYSRKTFHFLFKTIRRDQIYSKNTFQ